MSPYIGFLFHCGSDPYSKVGKALLKAKRVGSDPYATIEAVIPWADFEQSVADAERFARPASFDYLRLVDGASVLPGVAQILSLPPSI